MAWCLVKRRDNFTLPSLYPYLIDLYLLLHFETPTAGGLLQLSTRYNLQKYKFETGTATEGINICKNLLRLN